MASISTHILDTALGKPGEGIEIILERKTGAGFEKIGGGLTNSDGRLPGLIPADTQISAGHYRITFLTESYFRKQNRETFYPHTVIEFYITKEKENEHYHVPLLISGYGVSTYRGS